MKNCWRLKSARAEWPEAKGAGGTGESSREGEAEGLGSFVTPSHERARTEGSLSEEDRKGNPSMLIHF